MFLRRSIVLTVAMVGLAIMGRGAWADGSDIAVQALSIPAGTSNGVSIPDSSTINPGGTQFSITWEFWIKPPTIPTSGSSARQLIARKASSNTLGIFVIDLGNNLAVGIDVVPSSQGTSDLFIPLTKEGWQHIAIVYRHTEGATLETLQLFKNGVLVSQNATKSFTNPSNSAPLIIGNNGSTVGGNITAALACEIDEFRVWAGTGSDISSTGFRSQAEIQANMSLADDVAAGTDSLGARLRFDSGPIDAPVGSVSLLGSASTTPSNAGIGDSISKPLTAGTMTFDTGTIHTDLELRDVSNIVITSGSGQITVARIPVSPATAGLPIESTTGTTTISTKQFWLISHDGSSAILPVYTGTSITPIDAVASTASVALNLAQEVGVINPDDLRLLEASFADGNPSDDWNDVANADDPLTDASTAVFPTSPATLAIFNTTTPHVANVYALGGAGDNPLPVELASFSAQAQDGKVVLRWATASESDNLGFNVYRSRTPNGKFTKLNSRLIPGLGTSGSGREYQWVDEAATEGEVYYYYIEDVSLDGQTERSEVFPVMPKGHPATLLTPTKTRLFQNYPNAFNPDTWIPYQLNQAADVLIQIYDIRGTLIRTLTLGQKPTGYYLEQGRAAYWDGRNQAGERVTSGTYFYRFQAGDFVSLKKMVLLK